MSGSTDTVKRQVLVVSLILLLSGIVFILIGAATHKPGDSSGNLIYYHLGVGFISAGLLSAIVDRANSVRHLRDIEEIKQSASASAVSTVFVKPIYDEISRHIIKQDIRRSKCSGDVTIRWVDKNKRDLVHFTDVFIYELENISGRGINEFNISAIEENLREMTTYELRIIDNSPVNSKANIIINKQLVDEKRVRDVDGGLSSEMIYPVSFDKDEVKKVTVIVTSIKASIDYYSYVTSFPTDRLELSVDHPDDLELSSSLFHPSEDKLEISIDNEYKKKWVINTGLLPFQGIQLYWKPK